MNIRLKNQSVDLNKLKFEIMVSKITKKKISEELNITVQSVANKLNGVTAITTDELSAISKLLNKEQSFFLKRML